MTLHHLDELRTNLALLGCGGGGGSADEENLFQHPDPKAAQKVTKMICGVE